MLPTIGQPPPPVSAQHSESALCTHGCPPPPCGAARDHAAEEELGRVRAAAGAGGAVPGAADGVGRHGPRPRVRVQPGAPGRRVGYGGRGPRPSLLLPMGGGYGPFPGGHRCGAPPSTPGANRDVQDTKAVAVEGARIAEQCLAIVCPRCRPPPSSSPPVGGGGGSRPPRISWNPPLYAPSSPPGKLASSFLRLAVDRHFACPREWPPPQSSPIWSHGCGKPAPLLVPADLAAATCPGVYAPGQEGFGESLEVLADPPVGRYWTARSPGTVPPNGGGGFLLPAFP